MRVFITGSSGFVGFHLAKSLLKEGFKVYGYDGLTDYYDVQLKLDRTNILKDYDGFETSQAMLEDKNSLKKSIEKFNPNIIVHLAAQAGVRYSLENPGSYIESNIIGTFNLLEVIRSCKIEHFLMASTSSVYGSNEILPFKETEKADTPLTLYAATKKANEAICHSYAHLWDIPTTIFRFFTVYGPWGRPDMALFKFTSSILNNKPIDVFNYGEMFRDFTYIDDLVKAIRLLIDINPSKNKFSKSVSKNDSKSNVAPYRIVNIGNSDQVKLLDFIEAIENALSIKAKKNMLPLQPGDVPATMANTKLLFELTGFSSKTNYKKGVKEFIKWYKNYYDI